MGNDIAPFMTTAPDGRTLVPGGKIYRPPSEHDSLLLQVTVGCSHNRCSYCAMYTEKRFAVRPFVEVCEVIDAWTEMPPPPSRRVFLCDGDALILPQRKLMPVLQRVKERLPWVEHIRSYGDCRSILRKSVAELTELRQAGLTMIYHGVETGDDASMAAIVKGSKRDEVIESSDRLRAAGIQHSVILLLGIGGASGSARHAAETASLLTRIDPPFCGALTTTLVPGTPLFDLAQRGEFVLPGKFEMLRELRTLIADSQLSACRFSSNHASNYVPLRGLLSRDKEGMLAALDTIIERADDRLLRPDWLRGL